MKKFLTYFSRIVLLFLILQLFSFNAFSQKVTVTPDPVDFGEVASETELTKTFTVKNVYSEALMIDFEEWDSQTNGFEVNSITPAGELTLSAGASRTYTVIITSPNEYDLFLGYLNLEYSNNNIGSETYSILLKLHVIAPPSAPSNLIAENITDNSCKLDWSGPSGSGEVYNIYNGTSYINTTTIGQYNVNGLNQSTDYKFSVTAVGIGGESERADVYVRTKPTAPTISSSNVTASSCILSWATTGAAKYYVYKDNSLLTSTTSTSVTISDLCSETEYEFYVKAYDNVNYSDKSNVVTLTTSIFTISGSGVVCNYNRTYYVDNIPFGSTTVWLRSSNIDYIGGQGTSEYIVKAPITNTPYTGWIKATITTPNCGVFEVTKDVIVSNAPSQPVIMVPCEPVNCNYEAVVAAYTPQENVGFDWEIFGGSILSEDNPTMYYQANCPPPKLNRNFYFTLKVRAHNECGLTSYTQREVEVFNHPFIQNPTGVEPNIDPKDILLTDQAMNEPGEQFQLTYSENKLVIKPNPADSYIEAEIMDADFEVLNNNGMQITLFNNMGVPVYTENSHQKSFKINTSSMLNGIYVLQLIYNEEKYVEQIIIKH